MNKPLLTIVTITFNDFIGLQNTFNSAKALLNQNIEWIIKDGGSSKNTFEKIKNLTKDNKKIRLISSKDRGIYHAMNIGLNYAKGEWLIFMNGGDCFDSPLFYEKFIDYLKKNKIDSSYKNIILGNYNLVYPKGNKVFIKTRNLNDCMGSNSYRMPTCHQSQIFSRNLYSKIRYRETLTISADHAFFWDSFKKGAIISYFNFTISNFKTGGKSYEKYLLSLKDVCFSLWYIQDIKGLKFLVAIVKRILAFCLIIFREKINQIFFRENLY